MVPASLSPLSARRFSLNFANSRSRAPQADSLKSDKNVFISAPRVKEKAKTTAFTTTQSTEGRTKDYKETANSTTKTTQHRRQDPAKKAATTRVQAFNKTQQHQQNES